MTKKPIMLMILDGWGISETTEGNAIAQARKPFYDRLVKEYPHAVLEASGEAVGLPQGQMGNSEVGHLNIGAGRVVYQELTRINRDVRQGKIRENRVLVEAMDKALEHDKPLHLLGLLSDGGVHSHLDHLMALLDMAKDKGLRKIFIHIILDGRDVPPASAKEYIVELEKKLKSLGVGKIATVAGRYYTMDRDKRWDRVEKGYRAMVAGEGMKANLAMEALERSYNLKVTDEFVEPTVIVNDQGAPVGKIGKDDVVIMFNFRADRARQISHAFTDREFQNFTRPGGYLNLHYVCFTQYDVAIDAPVAYPPQNLDNTLGEVVSTAELKQLRIAETEKYAHVTFFFNGGIEEAYEGEDRVLINSPKVATYNLQPEMSACQVTNKVIEKIRENKYDLIVLNYANPDMVGHTGQITACVKAIETIDSCMESVVKAVLEQDGVLFITADHGNAECMLDCQTQQPHTAHTSNLVPALLVSTDKNEFELREKGALQDIAPTLLDLLNLAKPQEMTGESLLVKKSD